MSLRERESALIGCGCLECNAKRRQDQAESQARDREHQGALRLAVEAERERCLRWARAWPRLAWAEVEAGIQSGAEPPGEGKL